MAEVTTQKPQLKWTGLGLWNVFFIGEFLLSAAGYLQLNLVQNCILLAFVIVPIRNRALSIIRTIIAIIAAIALAYSESWLPSVESFFANFHNLVAMETGYLLDSAFNFLNFEMIGIGFVLVVAYYGLRKYVRITTFTILYLLALIAAPVWQPIVDRIQHPPVVTAAATTETEQQAEEPEGEKLDHGLLPQTEPPTSQNLDKWLRAFHEKERDRRAELPDKLGKDDTPFDILLVNICSLSNADLKDVGLTEHPLFKDVNITFTKFNAATSYSGPAATRILKSVCGQPSHDDLYEGRNPDCELMNRLAELGYDQYLFMDHSGAYDNFLQMLRHLAGLTPPLTQPMKYPKKYESFDEEPIGDTSAVFDDWINTVKANHDVRTAAFFNLIALHDGNRVPGKKRLAPFKPRAQAMLDDLDKFIKELETTGRKVMLIIIPEHGAAEVGDKVQVAKLRDIPSTAITNVPVWIKFVGIEGEGQVTVDTPSSYLAVSSLIGRVLTDNYFSKPEGTVPLKELVADLPQTEAVSENGNAKVITYQGKDYVKLEKNDWREYAK